MTVQPRVERWGMLLSRLWRWKVIPKQYWFVAQEEYADPFVCHECFYYRENIVILKYATKPFNVLLACTRPFIAELADKLRLKYPPQPSCPLTPQCDWRQYAISYL